MKISKTLNLLLLFAITSFISCSTEDNPLEIPLESEKQILKYSIEASKNGLKNNIEGVINEEAKTITFESKVPVEKDLIATFSAKGEVFIGPTKQISGETANNFADNIVYKVIAEDGSSVTYDLIVKPDNEGIPLTNFKLKIKQDGRERIIEGKYNDSETIITLNVPLSELWIENIESAVATFDTEGIAYVEGVEQESGVTMNDFRKELIYEIKSADNSSTRKYRVVLVSPQSTGLPVLKIETEGGKPIVDKENYINASFDLTDVINKTYDFNSIVGGIRGRGNSTWMMYPKKPYRIKFDKKTSVLGLGDAKSWVLRANYQDPTFIMDAFAFELGQKLGLEFTNHPRHVEVFLNGNHLGHYLLTEQVQVNKNRVNIDEDNGFLVELDTYYDEDFKFKSPILELPVNVKSPEVNSESEIAFVKDAITELESKLFDGKFPENNYKELIDINTVIKYILVNEVTSNSEPGHPKSVYMYKDVNSKIKMGPVWDFDWAFSHDDDDFNYFIRTNDRFYSKKTDGRIGNKFFSQFFNDPEFVKAYKAYWNEVKGDLATMEQYILEQERAFRKSAVQNRKLWDNKLNYSEQMGKMRSWYLERLSFLDESINND